MSDPVLDAIRRDGTALALAARRLLELRCAQAAGGEGRALAHALADMMTDGEYLRGWPLSDAIALLDATDSGPCARTAALRRRLVDLAERLAHCDDDAIDPTETAEAA